MRAVTTAASFVVVCVVAAAAHPPSLAPVPATNDERKLTPVPIDAKTSALAYILAKANIAQELIKLFPSDLSPVDTSQPTHSGIEWNSPHIHAENNEVPSTDNHKENSRTGEHEDSGENNEKYQVNKNHCKFDSCSSKNNDLNRKNVENNEEKHKEYNEKDKENKPRHQNLHNIIEQKHQENNNSQKNNKEYFENSNKKYQDSSTYAKISKLLDKHNLPEDLVSLLNRLNDNKQTDSKHNHIVVLKHKNKGKNKDKHVHNKINENLNALTKDFSAEIINLHGSDDTDDDSSPITSEKVIDLSTKQDLSEDKKVIELPSKTSVKSEEVINLPVILQNYNEIINKKPIGIHTLETRSKEMIVIKSDQLEDGFVNKVDFSHLSDVTNIGPIVTEAVVVNKLDPLEDDISTQDSYLVDSSSESSSSEYDTNEDFLSNDEVNEVDINEMPLEAIHKSEVVDIIKSTDIHEILPDKLELIVKPEFHEMVNFEDQIIKPLGKNLYNVVTSQKNIIKAQNDVISTSQNAVVLKSQEPAPVKSELKEKTEILTGLDKLPLAIVQEPVDHKNDHDHEADHHLELKSNLPLTYDNDIGHIINPNLMELQDPNDHNREPALDLDLETMPVAVVQEPIITSDYDHKIKHLLDPNLELPSAYDHMGDHDHKQLDHNYLSQDLSLAYEVKEDYIINHGLNNKNHHDYKVDLLSEDLKSNKYTNNDHKIDHLPLDFNLPLAYKVHTNDPKNDLPHRKYHDHKIDQTLDDHKNDLPLATQRDGNNVGDSLPSPHVVNGDVSVINDNHSANHYDDVHQKQVKLHHHHNDISINDELIIDVAQQDNGEITKVEVTDDIRYTKDLHKFDDSNYISTAFGDDNKLTTQLNNDILNDTPHSQHHHYKDLHKLDDSDYKDENDVIDNALTIHQIDNGLQDVHHHHKGSSIIDVPSSSQEVPSSLHDVHTSSNDVSSSSHDLHSSSHEDPSSSHDVYSPSHDVPNSSQEVPSSSHDVHTSSNDVPSSLHDVHTSSNDVPSSSHDLHSSSHSPSHYVPSSSQEVPSSSHDVHTSSNDVPSSSHDLHSSSHDVHSSSHDVYSPSHDVPSSSHDVYSPSHDVPSSSFDIHSSSYDVPSSSHDVNSSSHDHVFISLLDVLPLLSINAEVPIAPHFEQNHISSSHDDVIVPSSSHEVEVPVSTHEGEPISLLDMISGLSNDAGVPISSHDVHSLSHNMPSSSHDHSPISLFDILSISPSDASSLSHEDSSSLRDVFSSSHDLPTSHNHNPISLLDLLSISSPGTPSSLHKVHSSSHNVYNSLVPAPSHDHRALVPSHSVAPSLSTSNKLDDVQQQKYYQLSFVFNK